MAQANLEDLGVHEMLGAVLDETPPLASTLRASTGPLVAQRSMLRDALSRRDALRELPKDTPYLSLAAVDGAYTATPLFVGDQTNVLALAIRSTFDTGNLSIIGYRPASRFLPHSPDNEGYAKTAMLVSELDLLSEIATPDTVTLVDGSHTTAMTSILEGLTREGTPLYRLLTQPETEELIVGAIEVLTGREDVVASPKSDSSTELAAFVREQGVTLGLDFPDKVLASLLLDPGEVLVLPESHAPWGRYDIMARAVTSQHGQALRDKLGVLADGLRDGLRVAHIKPEGSSTAIRVETKRSIDEFETGDYWQAVADDCAPPYTQEPVAQYLVDHLAKSVSEVSKVQLDEARLDLAEAADDELLEFLVRTYRTA